MMLSKETQIMTLEARIAKLSMNRVVNQNLINKCNRTLKKLKNS